MNIQAIAFLQNLSSPELILIFLVVLLFFGAKRLPELSRSLGKSLREFKKATSHIEEDIRSAMNEEPEPVKPVKPVKPAKTATPATTEPKAIEPEAIKPEATNDSAEVAEATDTEKAHPKA